MDSYMHLIKTAKLYPKQYELRYFDEPMSGFNDQAKWGVERYALKTKTGQQTK